MEEHRVLLVLGLEKMPPPDILEELIEEEVFSIRDYFLRNYVVSVLYNARNRKLKQFKEIRVAYLDSLPSELKIDTASDLDTNSMISLLESFEKRLAECRAEMSKGLDPSVLIAISERMIGIQQNFENEFVRLFNIVYSNESSLSEEAVKASDQLATGRILLALKSGKSEEVLADLQKEYRRIKLLISK